jgi:hypothetical protein
MKRIFVLVLLIFTDLLIDKQVVPAQLSSEAQVSSDDHGITWKIGGSTPQDQVNECTLAELPDRGLILNMRNYVLKRG